MSTTVYDNRMICHAYSAVVSTVHFTAVQSMYIRGDRIRLSIWNAQTAHHLVMKRGKG
jgi:hypothetical protein